MEFFKHSNRVEELAERPSLWALIKKGIEACPEGMSFAIRLDQADDFTNINAYVSQLSKKAGKRFKIVAHEECYEIARLETGRTFIGSGNEPGAQSQAMPQPATQQSDPFNWPLPNLDGVEDHAERLRLCTIDPNPEYDGEYQVNRPKPPALKAIIRTEMIALGLPVPNEE